jgi:hypothetical protein
MRAPIRRTLRVSAQSLDGDIEFYMHERLRNYMRGSAYTRRGKETLNPTAGFSVIPARAGARFMDLSAYDRLA